tara:strand:+ start:334 stop:567 length:234 start_codon:yes stop_codon:yes gene_type:complete
VGAGAIDQKVGIIGDDFQGVRDGQDRCFRRTGDKPGIAGLGEIKRALFERAAIGRIGQFFKPCCTFSFLAEGDQRER